MAKIKPKKMTLHRETLKTLTLSDARLVKGGLIESERPWDKSCMGSCSDIVC